MTERSFNRKDWIGESEIGDVPSRQIVYSQSGGNASRAERRAGIYKDHPYNMTKTTTVKPQTKAQLSWPGTYPIYGVSTDWFGAMPVFGDVPPPNLSKAIAKLLEKWRGSTFDAGVTFGEGKESVMMIVQRLRSLAASAVALRKGNFGGALAALAHVPKSDRRNAVKRINSGHFAGAWLELQYGWKPLLNDIYAAAEFVKAKPAVGVIRSSVKETSDVCTPVNPTVFPQSGIALIVNERRRHLKVTVTNTPTVYERLGLTDPLSIAWELVPFSFVVDWFAPIGDAIKAMHAGNVMNVTSCCDTSVTNRLALLSVVNGQQYGSYVCRQSAISRWDYISMSRSVSSSLPSNWEIAANVAARFFLAPLDTSTQRLTTSAALARSQLHKLR